MEKQSDSDTIFEEREEYMVSATGGYHTRRKTHFLKPTATSKKGTVPGLFPDCLSTKPLACDDLKDLSEKVSLKGWKHPTRKWKKWVQNMHSKYQALWKQAGIYEGVMSSRYDLKQHKEIVLGIAKRWCSDTNTFIFPWGEATITLEDLMVFGGFSVLGASVLTPLKTKQLAEIEEKLIEGRREATRGSSLQPTHKAWMDYFMGTGHELEHEAFLSVWLSKFVLGSSVSFQFVGKHVFPIAIHLARGTRIALAPAVLSSIYSDLSLLKSCLCGSNMMQTNELVNLYAPFELIQIWVWERFPSLGPMPNSISPGEPRVARWHRLKVNVGNVKLAIDSAGKSFQWRPYAIAVKNWSFPKFYGDEEQYLLAGSHLDEELESYARCLRVSELVGLKSVEQYLPHRVAMQFGMDQDLPGCFARCNKNPKIAWRNYSRPIQDAMFYIPPRLFESDVTIQYSSWWKQSMLTHCDAIKPYVRRPRSRRKLQDVSVREKECHNFLSADYLLKCGEDSRGNLAKGNEDRWMEAEDLVQEEHMEDQLTIRELLASSKHNREEIVIVGESESYQDAQSPLSSTGEIETPAKMEANMKPGEVDIEASIKDQKDAIMEDIGEGDKLCFTVAVDVSPLSVAQKQEISTFIADKENIKKAESEMKQDEKATRNENSIGESKGVVVEDVKNKPGLKYRGEGCTADDTLTLASEIEARVCRLEKLVAEVKEKRFRNKMENHFKWVSSEP